MTPGKICGLELRAQAMAGAPPAARAAGGPPGSEVVGCTAAPWCSAAQSTYPRRPAIRGPWGSGAAA